MWPRLSDRNCQVILFTLSISPSREAETINDMSWENKQKEDGQKINIPYTNPVVVILFVTKTDKQSEQGCECVGMMMIIMIMTLINARVVLLNPSR